MKSFGHFIFLLFIYIPAYSHNNWDWQMPLLNGHDYNEIHLSSASFSEGVFIITTTDRNAFTSSEKVVVKKQ